MNDLPLIIVERLANERRAREARQRSVQQALRVLGIFQPDDVRVAYNPLMLDGQTADSYLEQATIEMPEVQPGDADGVVQALKSLIRAAHHVERDSLTDDERVAIGWADLAA